MHKKPERHFAHWSQIPSGLAQCSPALIARLLEDGHGEDLRWLWRKVSESEVGDLFCERGGRQLSRRSQAFWAIVLGLPKPTASPLADDLWPL